MREGYVKLAKEQARFLDLLVGKVLWAFDPLNLDSLILFFFFSFGFLPYVWFTTL